MKITFNQTLIIIATIIVVGVILYLALDNKKLSKELTTLKEETLVHNTKVIDTLRKENVKLIKSLTELNERILDYKIALKKLRDHNAQLIEKTKTVYIPELKHNRTSKEILSDLERHRHYIFMSDLDEPLKKQ